MIKVKSTIIIDGSNFYHKLKELNLRQTSSFSFAMFVKYISKNTKVQRKYYCVGKIMAKQNDKKAREMMAKQQSFVTKLQKQDFVIQFGYLLKSDAHFHEKGVDVQIATDLLAGAFEDEFDKAFLLTSDSDLIPAIQKVKSIGKEVVYVGFENKPSFALLKTCSQSVLLTKDQIMNFIEK